MGLIQFAEILGVQIFSHFTYLLTQTEIGRLNSVIYGLSWGRLP